MPLDEKQIAALKGFVEQDPAAKMSRLRLLGQRGIKPEDIGVELSTLETVDVVGSEFLKGAKEGITFGLIDAGEGDSLDPTVGRPPLIGDIVPEMSGARAAGNVVGGFIPGMLLSPLAAAKGAQLGAKGAQLMRAGTKGQQIAGRVGGFVAPAVTEGVIGGAAAGFREESIAKGIEGLVEWTALGILTDGALRGVTKSISTLRRAAARGHVTQSEAQAIAKDLEPARRETAEAADVQDAAGHSDAAQQARDFSAQVNTAIRNGEVADDFVPPAGPREEVIDPRDVDAPAPVEPAAESVLDDLYNNPEHLKLTQQGRDVAAAQFFDESVVDHGRAEVAFRSRQNRQSPDTQAAIDAEKAALARRKKRITPQVLNLQRRLSTLLRSMKNRDVNEQMTRAQLAQAVGASPDDMHFARALDRLIHDQVDGAIETAGGIRLRQDKEAGTLLRKPLRQVETEQLAQDQRTRVRLESEDLPRVQRSNQRFAQDPASFKNNLFQELSIRASSVPEQMVDYGNSLKGAFRSIQQQADQGPVNIAAAARHLDRQLESVFDELVAAQRLPAGASLQWADEYARLHYNALRAVSSNLMDPDDAAERIITNIYRGARTQDVLDHFDQVAKSAGPVHASHGIDELPSHDAFVEASETGLRQPEPAAKNDWVEVHDGDRIVEGRWVDGPDDEIIWAIETRSGQIEHVPRQQGAVMQKLMGPQRGGAAPDIAGREQLQMARDLDAQLHRRGHPHPDTTKLPDMKSAEDVRTFIDQALVLNRELDDLDVEVQIHKAEMHNKGLIPDEKLSPEAPTTTKDPATISSNPIRQLGPPGSRLAQKNIYYRQLTDYTRRFLDQLAARETGWLKRKSDIDETLGRTADDANIRSAGDVNARFLTKALAGEAVPPNVAADPGFQRGLNAARELMRELMEDMGLPAGTPLNKALAVMLQNNSGINRTVREAVLQGMDAKNRKVFEDFSMGSTTNPDTGRLIRHALLNKEIDFRRIDPQLQPRIDVTRIDEDFLKRARQWSTLDYDFDRIMWVMIRAATEHKKQRGLWRQYGSTMAAIRDQVAPRAGARLTRILEGDVTSYVRHAAGLPTDTRIKTAEFFHNSEFFNRGVDRLILLLGGSQDKAVLSRLRDGSYTPQDVNQAVEFMDELTRKAKEGKGILEGSTEKARAQMAIKANDMRRALADPNRQGPVLQTIYRWMILSRLGFNLGHGLVNLTQYLTNTVPLLGASGASRGISHLMNRKDGLINGRHIQDLLTESGVERDLKRFDDGLTQYQGTEGIKRGFQKIAMFPSEASERWLRVATFLGSYDQRTTAGASHAAAMKYARDVTDEANFVFTRAGTPPALRGPLARLIFMFQSYGLNQLSFSHNLLVSALSAAKKGGVKKSLKAAGEVLRPSGIDPIEGIEDMEPFQKFVRHMIAYAGLTAGGAWLLDETSLSERTAHPVLDQAMNVQENASRYGIAGSLAKGFLGPIADVPDHVMHMGVADGLYHQLPGTLRRLAEDGIPASAADLRDLAGLRPFNR